MTPAAYADATIVSGGAKPSGIVQPAPGAQAAASVQQVDDKELASVSTTPPELAYRRASNAANGRGLFAAGVVFLTLGPILLLAGQATTILAENRGELAAGITFLGAGLSLTGAGIPMVVIGKRRMRASGN